MKKSIRSLLTLTAAAVTSISLFNNDSLAPSIESTSEPARSAISPKNGIAVLNSVNSPAPETGELTTASEIALHFKGNTPLTHDDFYEQNIELIKSGKLAEMYRADALNDEKLNVIPQPFRTQVEEKLANINIIFEQGEYTTFPDYEDGSICVPLRVEDVDLSNENNRKSILGPAVYSCAKFSFNLDADGFPVYDGLPALDSIYEVDRLLWNISMLQDGKVDEVFSNAEYQYDPSSGAKVATMYHILTENKTLGKWHFWNVFFNDEQPFAKYSKYLKNSGYYYNRIDACPESNFYRWEKTPQEKFDNSGHSASCPYFGVF